MPSESRIGLPLPTVAIGFRPEFLDFQRGIRVGNLEDNQRITRILKLALESSYRQAFVTERWGRGVYWQWIGFLPRANRTAKPISAHVSFGCSKFFLMVDLQEKLFKCGLQVERGYLKAPAEYRHCELGSDWDWHRLLQALKPKSAMEHELKRLVLWEGFRLQAGSWEGQPGHFSKANFPSMAKLRSQLQAAARNQWSGFQIFYPMRESEVQAATGVDLVESMIQGGHSRYESLHADPTRLRGALRLLEWKRHLHDGTSPIACLNQEPKIEAQKWRKDRSLSLKGKQRLHNFRFHHFTRPRVTSKMTPCHQRVAGISRQNCLTERQGIHRVPSSLTQTLPKKARSFLLKESKTNRTVKANEQITDEE